MICGGECGTFNPLLIECLTDIADDLKKELKTSSSLVRNKREIQDINNEILNNSDLSSSAQMLQQIAFERGKSEFFEGELSDISFTFQSNPPVLTVPESDAKRLGINSIISDPLENSEIKKNANGSLKQLLEELAHSTSENPVFDMNGNIYVDGETTECKYHCKTLWMPSKNPIYIGTVGTISLQ